MGSSPEAPAVITENSKGQRGIERMPLELVRIAIGPTWRHLLGGCNVDEITASNLLLYHGFTEGRFDAETEIASVPDLIEFSKPFTARLKVLSSSLPDTQRLERQVLPGFKVDVPDYDTLRDDVVSLATSAPPRDWPDFRAMMEEALEEIFPPRNLDQKMSFVDFVESPWLWQTSGSSWESAEFEGSRLRLTKNLLADFKGLRELAFRALATKVWEHKAIVKSETGKHRIAVSSDDLTYLKMRYVDYLYGNWKDGPYMTFSAEVKGTLFDIVASMSRRPAISFDIRGFDHTVNHWFEKMVYRQLAKSNGHPDYRLVLANLIIGVDHQVISAPAPLNVPPRIMKSGVASGIGDTSKMGNAFTSALCICIRIYLAKLSLKAEMIIRADDLGFAAAKEALLHIMGFMEACEIPAAPGKFGVVTGRIEFLRTWYTPTAARQFLARSINAITQRKPWAGEPLGRASKVWESIKAIIRCVQRGGSPAFAQVLVDTWRASEYAKYAMALNSPWPGLGSYISVSVRTPAVESKAGASVASEFRDEYGIDLSPSEAKELAAVRLSGKLQTSENLSLRRRALDGYNELLEAVDWDVRMLNLVKHLDSWDRKPQSMDYASAPFINAWLEVARLRDESIRDVLKTHYPKLLGAAAGLNVPLVLGVTLLTEGVGGGYYPRRWMENNRFFTNTRDRLLTTLFQSGGTKLTLIQGLAIASFVSAMVDSDLVGADPYVDRH